MTDLISRLRDWCRIDDSLGSRDLRLWREAADEIEHQQLCIRDLNGLLNEKRDEIERLRAALTDIAQHQDSEWPLRCQMNVRTARAALKETP